MPRTKRCTKCKNFKHSRRKIKIKGGSVEIIANTLIEGLAKYYCPYKWWSARFCIKNGDVCEHFEFK